MSTTEWVWQPNENENENIPAMSIDSAVVTDPPPLYVVIQAFHAHTVYTSSVEEINGQRIAPISGDEENSQVHLSCAFAVLAHNGA